MNKQTLIRAGLCLLLGLGALPAFSQVALKARVPFDFLVPGKTLPAGAYTLTIRPHSVRIQDAYGKPLAVVLASDAYQSAGHKGRIVFRCYRDRCFLAELWASAQEHGIEFPISRAEAESTRTQGGTLFALLAEESKP